MSINLKVYNKIGYEDVRQGMTLRIVTEGPGVKSDVEGTVAYLFRGWRLGRGPSFNMDGYDRVVFRDDLAVLHIVKYPYSTGTAVELYEVIDAIPDEPKGVGAVVRVVSIICPAGTMEAVKIGRDGSWVWVGNGVGVSWESISGCVLSQGYDYIKVLSEGVEL